MDCVVAERSWRIRSASCAAAGNAPGAAGKPPDDQLLGRDTRAVTIELSGGLGDLRPLGPGDGGPCPICGEEMAEKVYEERLGLSDGSTGCSGRYWHMKNEHGIMEDYDP
jgi:hypothetical protein